MNKKALEDVETQQYKMEKEPPIGSSYMAHKIFIFFIVMGLIFAIALLAFSKGNSKNEESEPQPQKIEVQR